MIHLPAPLRHIADEFFEWSSIDLTDTTLLDVYEYLTQTTPALQLGTVGRMFWRRGFTLRGPNASKHLQVVGRIGRGKSEFIRSLFLQHIEQGIGCTVIDPHGDLALDCLWSLVERGFYQRAGATDKVLYLDFSNPEYFLPWNILKEPYSPKITAEHIVEVCRRVWPYLAQAAPQFENIMKTAVTTLVENNEPITEMNTLLLNRTVRKQLLQDITDRAILELFDRYDSWGPAGALMRESTLNKAFLLTFNDCLRYTFGQRKNALNFRRIIDEGVSLIVNLSRLDDETQSLLGSLLAMGFENAAFSRADMPKDQRKLYAVAIDEFQTCTSKNEKGFNKSLFGGRKYRVKWIYSHQSLSQVTEELQAAFENTIRVCFAVGQTDAEYYAKIFGEFNPWDIKHDIEDEKARQKSHPAFFKPQETYEQWVDKLKKLPIRVAYTRVENRSQDIKTLRHLPFTTPYSKVEQLIKDYTKSLMTPLAVCKQEVDGILQPIPESAYTPQGQKLLPPPSHLLAPTIKRQRTLPEF